MATLDPATALNACETALRELMTYAYSSEFGPQWLTRIARSDRIEEWNKRSLIERQTRGTKGVVAVPDVGLSYAEFHDLVSIAKAHWGPLAAALGKQASVVPLLERLENLRNAIGHNRPLLPFERDLASGIAGQIRNQVVIYMSARDEAGNLYPRIESITDCFGQRIESASVVGEIAGNTGSNNILLRPGDLISFECVGLDPQDRQLAWSVGRWQPSESWVCGASGAQTTITWPITEQDVTETFTLGIFLATKDTPYHRFGRFDHRAIFTYRVRPPE